MAGDRTQRRMAAILAADVVGYSRLMGKNEERTLAALKDYREVIDGLIAYHGGRVFGSAGDSVIAEFASPVEAVRCATDMQLEIDKLKTERDEIIRKIKYGEDLADNLSIELASAKNDPDLARQVLAFLNAEQHVLQASGDSSTISFLLRQSTALSRSVTDALTPSVRELVTAPVPLFPSLSARIKVEVSLAAPSITLPEALVSVILSVV